MTANPNAAGVVTDAMVEERERFEAEFRRRYPSASLDRSGEGYFVSPARECWPLWQASPSSEAPLRAEIERLGEALDFAFETACAHEWHSSREKTVCGKCGALMFSGSVYYPAERLAIIARAALSPATEGAGQ